MGEADAARSSGRPLPTPTMPIEARPRIGRLVHWLGLSTCLLVGVAGSLVAYAEGLPRVANSGWHLDKVLHFTVFGFTAFFLDAVLRRRAVRIAGMHVPVAALVILIPGGIEEFLQRFSPNRSSSVWDYLADVAGVVCLVWLSRRIER